MKTFNSKQYFAMITLFIFGSFILSHGNRLAEQDTWIAILYGFLIACPYILIIAYVCTKNEGLDGYEIFERYCGKFIGKLFSFFFIITGIIMGIFVCRIFIEYVHLTNLRQTPELVIGLLIIIVCIYAANQNIQVISRIASFLFIIFIISFIFVWVFSFANVNLENMMPINHTTSKQMFKASMDTFLNPFSEAYILLIYGKNLKKGSSHYKTLIITFILITLFLSFNSLRNVLILGTPAYNDLYFPSYISNTILNTGAIFERIELLFCFFYIFCIFIKITLGIKSSIIGLKFHFKKANEKYLAFFIGIVVLIIASFGFKNIDHFFTISYGHFREYLNYILMVIVFIIFVLTFIKRKKYINIKNTD